MNPEDEEFETYINTIHSDSLSTLINKLNAVKDHIDRSWDFKPWDDVAEESNKEVNFKDIDEAITGLSVEEFIEAIKQSGVWSVRGFKQEDLDAILMLNLDPLIMKLFLTFSLGELGQKRVLNYINDENPHNVW